MSIPLQRVTSLRLSAQANAPAASYRLHRVLEDGGRRDAPYEGVGGEARNAPLPCLSLDCISAIVVKIQMARATVDSVECHATRFGSRNGNVITPVSFTTE